MTMTIELGGDDVAVPLGNVVKIPGLRRNQCRFHLRFTIKTYLIAQRILSTGLHVANYPCTLACVLCCLKLCNEEGENAVWIRLEGIAIIQVEAKEMQSEYRKERKKRSALHLIPIRCVNVDYPQIGSGGNNRVAAGFVLDTLGSRCTKPALRRCTFVTYPTTKKREENIRTTQQIGYRKSTGSL